MLLRRRSNMILVLIFRSMTSNKARLNEYLSVGDLGKLLSITNFELLFYDEPLYSILD